MPVLDASVELGGVIWRTPMWAARSSPTWAPNGRVLMYYKQTPQNKQGGGVAKLYSIDITGHNEREVVTPMDGSDPAWSPLIP